MMKNKFFSPADFSDFEDSVVVLEASPKDDNRELKLDRMPRKTLLELKARLYAEFQRSECGTSLLHGRAIQASTTNPCKTTAERFFSAPTEENLSVLIKMIRQDYGAAVSNWAARELFSAYCPEILFQESKESLNE